MGTTKAVNMFLLIALFTCLIQTSLATPRDSTAEHEESVVPVINESLLPKEDTKVKSETTPTEVKIPGRISCDYEEATEDVVCQEHCLPKGYSYGICVSHACSCI